MSEEKLRNALRPGHKLHWYQIEKVLGQGGFGITYLAYDANLDQHVAIKEYLPMELAVREGDFSVYPASEAQDERYKWGLDRFLTEARTLARFKHSAIVRVMSVFEENNTAYMVMEYQQGQSLQELLERERTLTESELIDLVKPMLDGLETIHSQGFIHRDIKPSNIYIHDDGQPVLLDFGSARQALGEHTQTLTSVVSPGYAPFEQYYSRSDRQGPWTDIYGLGATLYRCITGLQPMAAIDRSEAILKAERDVFVAASEIGAGKYSHAFLAAVDHALQFNEKKRPQTIAEWRQQFDFSPSGEVEPRDSLNTTYPDHATTRFSEVLDDTFDITTGALFDSEVRDTEPQSRPSTRSKPHSAPSGPSLPSDTTPRSARRTRQEKPASAPLTATIFDAAKRRLWPITFLILVVTAAAWYFRDSGFIPQLVLTSKSGQEARRLIEQGDRALAAGQVFEPFDNSALAFYVAAYAASSKDPAVRHGLTIAGESLVSALEEAIVIDDIGRAEALGKTLLTIPGEVFDPTAAQTALASARGRWAEYSRRSERIEGFLNAAVQDLERGRLLGPGTDNALAKYRAVQILEPEHQGAAKGLLDLGVRVAALGSKALDGGKADEAGKWLAQARMLNPQAPEVAALESGLSKLRSKETATEVRQSEINQLLQTAITDVAANRLSSPAGKNALERYRRVLELEPGHPVALAGIEDIRDRYIAQATTALRNEDFERAAANLAKARKVQPGSPKVRALEQDIAATRERMDRDEAARLAAEAEQRIDQEARLRAEAERVRMEAERNRKQRQEAEAMRLLAEAERKAAGEKARAESQEKIDAELARPRIVVDFYGFHPKFSRYALTPERVMHEVEPMLTNAGYEIVKRHDVHDVGRAWSNVKLLVFKLYVNENTATGLYSYIGSVNFFRDEAVLLGLREAIDTKALWTRGQNGLGPPTDLQYLVDRFATLTQDFLRDSKRWRK